MRSYPVAALALTSVLACACGSSTAVSERCATDADCPTNALCLADGTCGCKNDQACAEGQFCNDVSVCQARAGCRDNRDCGATELCDLGTGACLPRTACGAATHCDLGTVCDDKTGRCINGCYDSGDCPLYQLCERTGVAENPLGRCVAGKCGDRTFCPLGDRCENQSCVDDAGSPNCRACDPQVVDSCGPGNYCLINASYDPNNPNSGSPNYCGVECNTAEDCGNGYGCSRIVLVSGSQALCTTDAQCTAPRHCRRSGENDLNGFCTCAGDSDCALDLVRFCPPKSCAGAGIVPCTQDSECLSRQCVSRCFGSNTMCDPSAPNANDACPAASVCQPNGVGGNVCANNTAQPCQTGVDCLCSGGRCFGSGRACTTSAQCQLSCQDGGCVLGAGCGPIEGLSCDDLR